MSDPSTGSDRAVPVTPENHTISIPSPLNLPSIIPDPNRPCLDLIQGSGEEYINVGVPLIEAALKGDWKAAEPILDKRPELVGFALTENLETLLHIAASAERSKAVEQFVVNLVNLMETRDLELQNKDGDTALSLAAESGNKETVIIMLKKNSILIDIPTNKNLTPKLTDVQNIKRLMPLYVAAFYAKAEMVRYLYDVSKQMSGDYWDNENRGWVLQKCVEGEIFDVAIKIVSDRPELLDRKGLLTNVLLALAQNTDAFEGKKKKFVSRIIKSFFAVFHVKVGNEISEALQLLRIIWRKMAKLPKREIDDIIRGPCIKIKNKTRESYPSRVLFVAAKMGNVRFITKFIRLYPDVVLKRDDEGKTLFHLAIEQRDLKIYKLIYEIGVWKNLITPIKDKNGNNMLHVVANYSYQKLFRSLSGAAFHMQSELLWYKEVEKIMPSQYREIKNNAEKTPQDLFTNTHVKLLKSAKDWMKTTASQCMVVSTLIATIVFAAAFTLPGGYKQDTGIPFFCKEPALIIFVISDAISLISSSTSVLLFLSIFTSRFAEKDFLVSLPRKLVYGIATLFLSIITMMIAFSASFFVLYNKKLEWLPITITGLASIPVILYVILENDLFKDGYKSGYRSKYLFNSSKHVLYH